MYYYISEVPTLVLEGHDGRVNCLLYPFNEAARYEPKHLVSGGADFSVCLWDIYDGSRLHTFTVHGGEVTQLLVPPNNCNVSVFYHYSVHRHVLNICVRTRTFHLLCSLA